MECPACGNASFCVLKLYTESEDDLSGQFLTVGRCFVCKLELSEDELKTLGCYKFPVLIFTRAFI